MSCFCVTGLGSIHIGVPPFTSFQICSRFYLGQMQQNEVVPTGVNVKPPTIIITISSMMDNRQTISDSMKQPMQIRKSMHKSIGWKYAFCHIRIK